MVYTTAKRRLTLTNVERRLRRSGGVSVDPRRSADPLSLDVEVHLELVGVRAEADRVHLVGPLVVDPRLDEVRGEDVPGEEVLVVGLEGVEDRGQRTGDLRD